MTLFYLILAALRLALHRVYWLTPVMHEIYFYFGRDLGPFYVAMTSLIAFLAIIFLIFHRKVGPQEEKFPMEFLL